MYKANVGIRPANDASLEVVQRQMRYVAYQQRRSAAPRCHPISIFVIVQAIGCIFMGLTMTIAGHWPGTGSRSVIILQTLGPVIVALGVLLLIIGILLARFLRKKEAKTWDKKISQHIMSTSRQVLDQSIPMYHMGLQAKPAFGPSTDEERKELLLSPSSVEEQLARKAAAFSPSDSETFNSSSSMIPPLRNDEDVPDPVRVTKVKKKNAGSSSSLENLDSMPEVTTKRSKKKTTSGDEELSQVSRTVKKHTTVTTTVTKRIVEDESDASEKPARAPKLKPPPPVPKKPSTVPDSPRLRVKVRASPGTSVNIRQSDSSFDGDASSVGYHRSRENVAQGGPAAVQPPKPKTKPKKQGKFEGTDI